MFKDYMKYIDSDLETLQDYLDLKKLGLTKEEIEGYFEFKNKERGSNERK